MAEVQAKVRAIPLHEWRIQTPYYFKHDSGVALYASGDVGMCGYIICTGLDDLFNTLYARMKSESQLREQQRLRDARRKFLNS